MYLNTRIFPTTGYARVLLFMFIRRELGGTGTGCYFSLHTVLIPLFKIADFEKKCRCKEIVDLFSMFKLIKIY